MGLLTLLAALALGVPASAAAPGPDAVAPQTSQWWTYEGETWSKATDEEVRVHPPEDRVYWSGGFTGRPLP